jgi:hypothetical protein
MLGAVEVKVISRLAAQHGREWKPVHTSVMDCLLAHRNRRTGDCRPHRRTIAAHCNVSERTIDRALEQLVAWGAIDRLQPKAVASRQFRAAQYVFLFEIPQPVENLCESEDKSCANQPEPCAKIEGGRATKSTGAVRQNRGANKEEAKDLEGKDQKRGSPRLSEFSQKDFDERDLRKMAEAWRYLAERVSPERTRGSGMTPREMFEVACELAGITIARGIELEELKKKWPENVPEWLREPKPAATF